MRLARRQSTERMFDGVGQVSENADIPIMTRATFERLRVELDRMERELRTTIPATIQRARELGDLKENAENHSAKLKQANVSKMVASLQLRLSHARFVDDLEYKDGIAGEGTEVVLESDSELTSYWILGEDEHHHGAHVVSFQAPVGRALVGHVIGDEVELGEGALRKRYRVVSVERRLPLPPTESDASTAER
jgi:transcription elongation factor GreA